jgi:hypothetical protein
MASCLFLPLRGLPFGAAYLYVRSLLGTHLQCELAVMRKAMYAAEEVRSPASQLLCRLIGSELVRCCRACPRGRAAKRIAGCPSCGGQRTGSSCTGACLRGHSQKVPARWALVALRERGQPAQPGLPLRVKPSHTSACKELLFSSTRALPSFSEDSYREHRSYVGT